MRPFVEVIDRSFNKIRLVFPSRTKSTEIAEFSTRPQERETVFEYHIIIHSRNLNTTYCNSLFVAGHDCPLRRVSGDKIGCVWAQSVRAQLLVHTFLHYTSRLRVPTRIWEYRPEHALSTRVLRVNTQKNTFSGLYFIFSRVDVSSRTTPTPRIHCPAAECRFVSRTLYALSVARGVHKPIL